VFDDIEPLRWRAADPARAGIWRYAAAIGLSHRDVSLGEGHTPLLAANAFGRRVFLKCEHRNPTGSFKDRGTAALIAFLLDRGVREAIEDSSGNAGASFAAYSARAGIGAQVYLPETASGPKRAQIEKYGAKVVPVPGMRSNATDAARMAADGGATYASHAFLPHNLAGYATCAFEVAEELGTGPSAVLMPAGEGGFLLGMGRGFKALVDAEIIPAAPKLVGVQAATCAPLVAAFENGARGNHTVTEGDTAAEGVRVRMPVRLEAVLRMVRESGGQMVAVEEQFIEPGRVALAHQGFYVEPTSALVWRALEETLPALPDPVVVVLTGSGYKVRATQEKQWNAL
jgi:threonine synthase